MGDEHVRRAQPVPAVNPEIDDRVYSTNLQFPPTLSGGP
jgi:hypothetical protein